MVYNRIPLCYYINVVRNKKRKGVLKMKIENSVIVKASLELAKEYKDINPKATYQEWLNDLEWDVSTVYIMERYLKTDIKDYLGVDVYINMMEYINLYCEELMDPTDFNLTFSQWLGIKIEGLLEYCDFNINSPIDIEKMKVIKNVK